MKLEINNQELELLDGIFEDSLDAQYWALMRAKMNSSEEAVVLMEKRLKETKAFILKVKHGLIDQNMENDGLHASLPCENPNCVCKAYL